MALHEVKVNLLWMHRAPILFFIGWFGTMVYLNLLIRYLIPWDMEVFVSFFFMFAVFILVTCILKSWYGGNSVLRINFLSTTIEKGSDYLFFTRYSSIWGIQDIQQFGTNQGHTQNTSDRIIITNQIHLIDQKNQMIELLSTNSESNNAANQFITTLYRLLVTWLTTPEYHYLKETSEFKDFEKMISQMYRRRTAGIIILICSFIAGFLIAWL